MTDTEVLNESNYIFQQSYAINFIFGIISIVLIIVAIANLIVLIFGNRYYYTSEGNQQDRLLILILSGIFSIAISISIYTGSNYFDHIKANPAFTIGTTTRWVRGDGTNEIDYYYSVSGKEYKSSSCPTYDGEDIPNIKVPNGKYRVIYNKENPEESIIDFKINCDTMKY